MTDEIDKLKARITMLEAKNLALAENNRHLDAMFGEASKMVIDVQKEAEAWRDVAYSRLYPKKGIRPKPKMSWEQGYDESVDKPRLRQSKPAKVLATKKARKAREARKASKE